jgi:porphobilinogen synthase
MNEMLLSIKRAGAKVILTYFAKDFAKQKFWFYFWTKL